MDKYRIAETFATDVQATTVNQITTDLRKALDRVYQEGNIQQSIYLQAWSIVDNWQGAIHQRQDTLWSQKHG